MPQRPDTLQIMSDSGIFDLSDRIAALAEMHRIPSFCNITQNSSGLVVYWVYGALQTLPFIRVRLFTSKGFFRGRNPVTCPSNSSTSGSELSINVRDCKST